MGPMSKQEWMERCEVIRMFPRERRSLARILLTEELDMRGKSWHGDKG